MVATWSVRNQPAIKTPHTGKVCAFFMQMYRTRAEKGFRQEGRSVYADKPPVNYGLLSSSWNSRFSIFLSYLFLSFFFFFQNFEFEIVTFDRVSTFHPIVNFVNQEEGKRREESGLKSRLTKIGRGQLLWSEWHRRLALPSQVSMGSRDRASKRRKPFRER